MPSCPNCGEHVSEAFKRTHSDNDGDLHGCPSCTDPATRWKRCAGLDPRYDPRSAPDGRTVVSDGGQGDV